MGAAAFPCRPPRANVLRSLLARYVPRADGRLQKKWKKERAAGCASERASRQGGSVEQTIRLEGLAELGFAGLVEGAQRQAHLAVAAAEELHRRLDRNGVGRQAEQVAAEGEQPAVPAQCLRKLAG